MVAGNLFKGDVKKSMVLHHFVRELPELVVRLVKRVEKQGENSEAVGFEQ
jgi:hypothetical protein